MAVSSVEQSSSPERLLPRGYGWMLALAVGGGLQVGFLLLDLSSILPLIRQQFGLDHVAAGWLISATVISHTCFLLVAGSIVDRIGPRRLLIFGMAALMVSSVFRAVAPTFPLLLLSRVVTGVGTASCGLGGISAITAFSPLRVRVRDQGFFGASQQLGIMLVLLSAPIIVPRVGRPVYWLVLAALQAVMLVLFALRFPAASRAPSLSQRAGFGATLRDGYGWALSLANTAGYGAFIGVTAWTASFIIERYGVSPGTTAWLTTGSTLFAFLGRLATGYIAALMGTRRLILGFVTLSGLSIAAAPLAPNALIAALMLLVFSWSSSVPFGAIFGSVSLRPAPAGIGQRVMLITVCGNALALLLPPLIGFTEHQTGSYTLGFWIASTLILVIALVLVRSPVGTEGVGVATA